MERDLNNQKKRSKIILDALKSVRRSIKRELIIKNIAEEVEISISYARNLYMIINSGTNQELLNLKKVEISKITMILPLK